MDAVYIDASECPRKVLGRFSSAVSQVMWIYGGLIVFGGAGIAISLSMPPDPPVWMPVLGIAAFTGAIVLPFVGVAWQDRTLKWSNMRIDAYGVTLRQILRSLARWRRGLDRAAGWSRTRTLALATLVRLAAVGLLISSFVFLMRNPGHEGWNGRIGFGGYVLAGTLWVLSRRLLCPKRAGIGLLLQTTAYRLVGIALFVGVVMASFFLYGLINTYWREHPPWQITIGIYVAGAAAGVAAFDRMRQMWRRANLRIHPTSTDLRRWDRRQPVLFLRSFPDDAQWVPLDMTSKLDQPEAVTLENALHERVGRYGPYIAVADPTRTVTATAARDRFTGEEWCAAVQNWMDEAVVITLVAGWTEGVH